MGYVSSSKSNIYCVNHHQIKKKMKNILLVLALMTSLILSAQDIVPIPSNSGAQWRITRAYNDGICANWHNSLYYVDGTEEHDGKLYYKIYETGDYYQTVTDPPGPCDDSYSYNGDYRGAIRSENGKTYAYNGEEELLMDFTLDVGDTLNTSISYGLVVGSIDSVLVGTAYRKRFNFSNGDICNWMVEGVGHETGLFEPMSTAMSFFSIMDCYGEYDEPLFGEMDCILNVGVEDLSANVSDVLIYPNPTSSALTVDLSQLTNTIASYSITDIYGKVIRTEAFVSSKPEMFVIDLSDFNSGIYFLKLNAENRDVVISKKIIKR